MLSKVEVTRRLPEVFLIEDMHLRNEVIEALQHTPDYFWVVPASTSGKYHNPMCRAEHGLWIHVKMAVTAAMRLSDSWIKQGLLAPYERDYVLAGLLLHDMFKQNAGEGHTTNDHDDYAADWLEQNTELVTPIIEAVRAHNGSYTESLEPEGCMFPYVSQMVHMADMAASSADGTWALYRPAREIREKYENWRQYSAL